MSAPSLKNQVRFAVKDIFTQEKNTRSNHLYLNGMFLKIAKNQEHVLLSHPIKYTFWSYDPCRECRLSDEKITAKPVGANCVRPKKREILPNYAGERSSPLRLRCSKSKNAPILPWDKCYF